MTDQQQIRNQSNGMPEWGVVKDGDGIIDMYCPATKEYITAVRYGSGVVVYVAVEASMACVALSPSAARVLVCKITQILDATEAPA
jgi:hypothetical protein